MNAIATATVVPKTKLLTTPPALRGIPDPLDHDLPSDEVVVTTRRGMIVERVTWHERYAPVERQS